MLRIFWSNRRDSTTVMQVGVVPGQFVQLGQGRLEFFY